jgi:uncharacterized protein
MARARLTTLAFPPYAHLPGVSVHPNQPGGHQHGTPEIETTPLKPGQYNNHQCYLYGLDLLNHGYFWESHVAFEAVWNAHLRQGSEALALKALIKLGAAGVKARAQSPAPTLGHLARAMDLIFEVDANIWQESFGLDQRELQAHIERLQSGPPFLDENECFYFELIPKNK